MTSMTAAPTTPKSSGNRQVRQCYFSLSAFDKLSYEGIPVQDQHCYTVVFMEQGGCECRMQEQTLLLEPYAVAVIKPKQRFTIVSGRESSGYILCFSYEFMQAALNSSGMAQEFHLSSTSGKVSVPEHDRHFLSDIVSRLRQEYQADKGFKDEILSGLFQLFTLYLNRISAERQRPVQSRCQYHMHRFFALLDEHFATLKMPADYAGLLAVSPSYLNFIMKENFGLNTSYFIQQRILAEAKKLMSGHEVTMKEVAYQLGFFDVSHFSKFFKRNTGIRFSDFRRLAAA